MLSTCLGHCIVHIDGKWLKSQQATNRNKVLNLLSTNNLGKLLSHSNTHLYVLTFSFTFNNQVLIQYITCVLMDQMILKIIL